MTQLLPHQALGKLAPRVSPTFLDIVHRAQQEGDATFQLWAYGYAHDFTMVPIDLKRVTTKTEMPAGLDPWDGMKDSPGGLICLYRDGQVDAYDLVLKRDVMVKAGEAVPVDKLARLGGRLPGATCTFDPGEEWEHTVIAIGPTKFDTTGLCANGLDESADKQFHFHERAVRWLRDKRRLAVDAATMAAWEARSEEDKVHREDDQRKGAGSVVGIHKRAATARAAGDASKAKKLKRLARELQSV